MVISYFLFNIFITVSKRDLMEISDNFEDCMRVEYYLYILQESFYPTIWTVYLDPWLEDIVLMMLVRNKDK